MRQLFCIILLFSITAQAQQFEALDCIIEPSMVVQLSTSVPGVIQSLEVEQGDLITKGQVLATLEAGVQQATVNQARARAKMSGHLESANAALQFAKRNLKRMEELSGRGVIAGHELDAAQTEVQMAQARVKAAKEDQRLARLELERALKDLDRRTMRSPLNGVVVDRFSAAGEYVDEAPVLKLATIDPLHVHALAQAAQFGSIKPGMKAQITPEASGERSLSATVTSVDRVLDAGSGTFGMRLELPNSDYQIPSGLKCSVQLSAMLIEDEAPVAAAVAEPDASSAAVTGAATASKQELMQNKSTPSPAQRELPQSALADVVPHDELLAADTMQCHNVGPFVGREQAQRAFDAISATGAQVQWIEEREKHLAGFLVLSEIFESESDLNNAYFALLESGETEVAMLTKPPHAGRVSFGFFKKRAPAENRLESLPQSVSASVVDRNLSRTVYTLSVADTALRSANVSWVSDKPIHDIIQPVPCELQINAQVN